MTASSNMEVPLVRVFAESLRYLKGHMMGTYLIDAAAELLVSDILWVVTIPSRADNTTATAVLNQAAELVLKTLN